MALMLDKINMVRIRGCWKASLCTSPVYASLLLFYHRERRDRGTTKRERERDATSKIHLLLCLLGGMQLLTWR